MFVDRFRFECSRQESAVVWLIFTFQVIFALEKQNFFRKTIRTRALSIARCSTFPNKQTLTMSTNHAVLFEIHHSEIQINISPYWLTDYTTFIHLWYLCWNALNTIYNIVMNIEKHFDFVLTVLWGFCGTKIILICLMGKPNGKNKKKHITSFKHWFNVDINVLALERRRFNVEMTSCAGWTKILFFIKTYDTVQPARILVYGNFGWFGCLKSVHDLILIVLLWRLLFADFICFSDFNVRFHSSLEATNFVNKSCNLSANLLYTGVPFIIRYS